MMKPTDGSEGTTTVLRKRIWASYRGNGAGGAMSSKVVDWRERPKETGRISTEQTSSTDIDVV